MAMEPGRVKTGFMTNQMEVSNRLLRFWADFAHWSRALYISTMYGLNDREPVRSRLIKNAGDFTQLLRTYYGEEAGGRYDTIIMHMYHNLFDVSDALYRYDAEQADILHTQLYDSIDEMIALLKSLNINLDEEALRKWLYELMYLTLEEAVMIYADEYMDGVQQSDKFMKLAAEIAGELAYQLISQLQCEGQSD